MVKNKIALVRVHIHNLYLLRYTWVEKYIQEINSLSMFGFYRGEDCTNQEVLECNEKKTFCW